jgi:hypothetical protein
MEPASDFVKFEVDYRKDIIGIDHPDARLIAAAPDMYEALKEIQKLPAIDGGGAITILPYHAKRISSLINKAVAKAEGRLP